MFNIHTASEKDIPLIRELTFRIWPQTYAAILSRQQIDYMLDLMYSETSLQQQMHDGAQFILVYNDGDPVGFASFQEMESNIYKLHKIYILAAKQGNGGGRFVIDYIIKEISMQGATALQLQVNRHNKAKDFYLHLGFTVIKEADFDIGEGYFMNDFVLEKKLQTIP